MSCPNLTDREWKSIRVFLPAERSGRVGRLWVSHRRVIDGILLVLCSGGRWKDVPAEFGNYKIIYNRFYRWTQEGMWKRIVNRLLHRLDALGMVDRSLWCVDSSVILAHRVASCARRGKLSGEENARKNALDRSQGGSSGLPSSSFSRDRPVYLRPPFQEIVQFTSPSFSRRFERSEGRILPFPLAILATHSSRALSKPSFP